ncbi:patatin-like phospholipase family protein [Variovorax rhizosphaerae]|uniref:Patatin-like phospholipase family protein n=1 Tax=Variovorax rhizosphaerae TaxID=1836200 RepID=A0ABU8WHF0_9BURK
MRVAFPIVTVLVLALCGCQVVSYQPSASSRGVDFPLKPCDEKLLADAREALLRGESLKYEEGWVCVTKPMGDAQISAKAAATIRAVPGELDAHDTREPAIQRAKSEAIAFESPGEKQLRELVETTFLQPDLGTARPKLGVSLAGGGSKAGAFGIGVLAGLADMELLDHADYISSVSGGSYAAYFYYTHRILPLEREGPRIKNVTTKELFWDCVQIPDVDRLGPGIPDEIYARGGCKDNALLPTNTGFPSNYYQAFLRCQQDIFNPGKCSTTVRRGDYFKSIAPETLAGNIALTPASWLANILFDWGLNASQAARTYRRGIGMAYGTTLTRSSALEHAGSAADLQVPCSPDAPAATQGFALDCERGQFLVAPEGMTYQELRNGLLRARGTSRPLPFWIINATAPLRRSAFGWWSPAVKDITNKDMFEMTAMSHGSGRFGYVPAPMSLHGMNVLDSVAASAAFLDSTQIALTNVLAKGTLGVTLRVTNFDWGSDISNYNVSDVQRGLHKLLPIPFYWADSGIARHLAPGAKVEDVHGKQEEDERKHGPYIRLIDGGNAENLGVFPLMKRHVKTIVIADSASDREGLFADLCAFRHRISAAPESFPRLFYVPGLKDFDHHCEDLLQSGIKRGYPIQEWSFKMPLLIGCLRTQLPRKPEEPCTDLDENVDSRVLIVKPAINVDNLIQRQVRNDAPNVPMPRRIITKCLLPGDIPPPEETPLLNCDSLQYLLARWDVEKGSCQSFPQHGTMTMTLDSSVFLFTAYRELGRQYLLQAQHLLHGLWRGDKAGIDQFEQLGRDQGSESQRLDDKFRPGGMPRELRCDNMREGPWQPYDFKAAGR